MKRLLLLLAVSAAASLCGLLPWQSHDAAELLPVQTLLVDYAGGQVYLRADGGPEGVGGALAGALESLEPYWQARESRGALTTLLSFCADGAPPQQLTEEGKAWTV